jgi:uncharacterized protein
VLLDNNSYFKYIPFMDNQSKTFLPMKIFVEVKPNSRKESLENLAPAKYRIRVNVPPTDGKANAAVIEALAKFFRIPKSKIVLVHGEKSKNKVFELPIDRI